jgi:hypothetical protein
VEDLNLTEEEFRAVARACATIRLSGGAPPYLQEFIVRRLGEAGRAGLAAKVAAYGPAQVQALAALLVGHQELGRRLLGGARGESAGGHGQGSASGAGNGNGGP